MKLLITGFKPFNHDLINPAKELLDYYYNKEDIETLLLDVEYNFDAKKIIDKVIDYQPDVILSLGLAGGRKKVMIEYYALNMHSATIPDNANTLLNHQSINSKSPIAYQTNIDVLELVNSVNDELFGISYHAGTFVCNDIYYQTLDYIYLNNLNIKCGFIHLPYLNEQVVDKPHLPSLSIEKMKEIIDKVIEYLC